MDGESTQTPENLWLLCSQLYSRTPNTLEKSGSYAWATLRASVLHSLSLLGSTSVSREAAELLLSLLTEISPNVPSSAAKKKVATAKGTSTRTMTRTLSSQSSGVQDASVESDIVGSLRVNTEEGDSSYYTNRFASRIRESFSTMTAASSLLAVEAKWADEHAVPPMLVPLSDPASQVLSLGSVWQVIDFQHCSVSQRECVERIVALRKTTSTASSAPHTTTDIYGTEFNTLPLYVASPMTVEEDKALGLTCVKKKVTPKAETGALATFFNPFAKKSDTFREIRVAGEEERVMVYQFGNSLAIPVRVSQCRLEFEGDIGDRVKSPTLTFEVPAKASSHTVRFPFTMVPPSGDKGDVGSELFTVKGISLSCMNRSFFLPVAPEPKGSEKVSKDLATPASNYPHRTKKAVEETSKEDKTLKLEVFPCQPNPKLAFLDPVAIIDADTKLEIGLTDGQVIATPSFRISNYSGPSGGGKIRRLQISVYGVPGTSESTIYDSETHEQTESADTSGDDFGRDLEQENPPALKIRLVSIKNLSLSTINESDESSYGQVAFQLAASHNLGQKIQSESTIYIRFKFSGQPTTSSEVWRIREIPIQISYIKGPRIASISLRPDLVQGPEYSQMCEILTCRSAGSTVQKAEEKTGNPSAAKQVGLDTGVDICSDTILAILVVVNETHEDIILSRSSGAVGGLEGHPLESIMLHSKVTSRIPVVLPRLSRFETSSSLVEALVEKTTLVWETAKAIKSTGQFARGRISVPVERLNDIVSSTPALGPSICESPIQVDLVVNGKAPSSDLVTVAPGQPIDISISAKVSPWVSKEIQEACKFTFEFFCSFQDHKKSNEVRDHMWCGKVRHTISGKEDAAFSHAAKVLLIQSGRYHLSGCVRISQGEADETWLALVAQEIFVDPALLPAQ